LQPAIIDGLAQTFLQSDQLGKKKKGQNLNHCEDKVEETIAALTQSQCQRFQSKK